MTAGEKAEQLLTSRPNSYVPARTLLTLLGKNRTTSNARPCGTTPCMGGLVRC